ncbi:hypothetical protein LLH00_03240, partial [bacterium]|nr:hypothetical protein [bacterium]
MKQFIGSVTAQSTDLAVTGLTVDPDTLSPANADGVADVAAVSYNLTRDAQVTIQVFRDSTVFNSNNLVRTLASASPQTAGTHNAIWDGKDGTGAYVSPGAEKSYRLIVTTLDPVSHQTSEARASIYVDNLKPSELVLNKLPAAVNVPGLTVSGRTEPGSKVEIYLDGAFADSVRANILTGVFDSTKVTLTKQGISKITARAFDAVGNGPTLSDTLSVLFDNRAPLVTDTLLYVSGAAQRLAGYVLLSYGPADTVELRLWDGSGRVSGLDLGRSAVQVTSPGGQDVEGKTIVLPPDRLRFVPSSTNTATGSYTLSISAYDSLGNSATYTVAFSVGQASSGPSVNMSGLVNAQAPAGYINAAQAQPWIFSVTLNDNTGTGINANASLMELYAMPGGKRLDGSTTFTTPATFTFVAAAAVATDGSKDGRYELRVVAEDNDPASGGLDTRLGFLYDSRPPDTLAFTASATRVTVSLHDPAGGSGVSLLGTLRSTLRVNVAGAGGSINTAEYSNDGDSTLIADFSTPLGADVYTAEVLIYDRAGNTRTRSLSFVVSGPELVPRIAGASGVPLSGVSSTTGLNQPITARFLISDPGGVGIDWSASLARLIGPDSVVVSGISDHEGNNLLFTPERFLSSNGSDDGRWSVAVHVATLNASVAALDTSVSFVLDNTPPDTLAISFAADSSEIYIDLV